MELTQERIVEELVAIGFARATDILDVKDGQTLLKEAADGTAIANLETTPKGVKVKFYDKLKALELLAQLAEEDSGDLEGFLKSLQEDTP